MTYLVYMDEAGYYGSWEKEIELLSKGENLEQPYYVLSGVAVKAEKYVENAPKVRDKFSELYSEENHNEENEENPDNQSMKLLGLGYEIKGGKVVTSNHPHKEELLELMFRFPQDNGGAAFLVVIDKKEHYNQNKDKREGPFDPYTWALQLLMERLQWYLQEKEDFAFVVYDMNHSLEKTLTKKALELRKNGSMIFSYGLPKKLKIDRIVEFTYARSETSLGLIVADFFASAAYIYHKTISSLNWWDELVIPSLYRYKDTEKGSGYKLFPDPKK